MFAWWTAILLCKTAIEIGLNGNAFYRTLTGWLLVGTVFRFFFSAHSHFLPVLKRVNIHSTARWLSEREKLSVLVAFGSYSLLHICERANLFLKHSQSLEALFLNIKM